MLVIICLCIYAFIEAIAGNLQIIYPAELFPTSMRAAGVGMAAALSRIGAAIGTLRVPEREGILRAIDGQHRPALVGVPVR